MEFMRRYHIESHLFLFVPKIEARPRSLATRHPLHLDRYRTGLCDAPSAEPIAKASSHDKHHAQWLPRQFTSPSVAAVRSGLSRNSSHLRRQEICHPNLIGHPPSLTVCECRVNPFNTRLPGLCIETGRGR
jgi:hypothetical protein